MAVLEIQNEFSLSFTQRESEIERNSLHYNFDNNFHCCNQLRCIMAAVTFDVTVTCNYNEFN